MGIRTATQLLLGAVFMAAPQAKADVRDDVMAGMERCRAIQDDRVWLDCVYGADQPMRAKLGLQPAPESQQRLVPPAPIGSVPPPIRALCRPAPKASFLDKLLGDVPPVAVSRMSSYRYDKSGAFIVTLENGQEWRQADLADGTTFWTKTPTTYSVTVTQGASGTYRLHTSDSSQTYRVELVK